MKIRKFLYLTLFAVMSASVNLYAQGGLQPNIDILAKIEASGNFEPMFPFLPTHSAPENITNVGTWTAVPRSEPFQGFISPKGETFVDGTGQPVRFIGTNIGMTGCFPDHSSADSVARELTRYGINIVRLHYVSHRTPKEGYPVLNSFIEPVQLERFDYLFAKLKEQGIYIYFQLNIARKFGRVNGFPDANLLPYYKNGIDNVDERMIELQKKFHKEILDHVNPYTGIAYKDDSSISMMELANENSIVHSWFSGRHKFTALIEPYKSEIIELWNKWLLDKYGDVETVRKAWREGAEEPVSQILPKSVNLKKGNVDWPYKKDWKKYPKRSSDFVEFLSGLESKYFADLYDNTKNNLGIRQPVTGTQLNYGFDEPQAATDYCDTHGYWCHPAFPGGKWDNKNWNVRNGSIVNSYGNPANVITKLAQARILGKPLTVSEYDHPNLNFYCAEGDIMLAAIGAFQNWSALMQFAWILDTDFDRTHLWPMFDMCSAPQKLVHFPACYAMFVRGDVKKADESVVFDYESSVEKDTPIMVEKQAANIIGARGSSLLSALPLAVKSGTTVKGYPELFSSEGRTVIRSDRDVPEVIKKAYNNKLMQSNTGELTWNWQQKDAGFFMVDARNTKVFTGFVKGRTFTYRGMRLTPGKTRLDWLTLSLTLAFPSGKSAAGNLLRAGSYLLAASGLVHNTDAKIVELSSAPGKISCSVPDGGRLGTAPVLCEGIEAQIAFSGLAGRVKCYALDSAGKRTVEVPVTRNDTGEAILEISPKYKTLWYELIIEPNK
jgi:hypothetical protein